MTIIACSRVERVMLADTLVTDERCNAQIAHVQKIVRCKDGSLAGAAGDSGPGMKFLDWAINRRKGEYPTVTEKEDLEGVVLTPAGDILAYWGPIPETILDPVFFVGAGSREAAAAIAAGATLERAVQVAIELSPKCGGSITRLELDTPRKKRK